MFIVLLSLSLFINVDFGVEQDFFFKLLIITGISSEVFSLGAYGILEGKAKYKILNIYFLSFAVARLTLISILSFYMELKPLLLAHILISIILGIVLMISFSSSVLKSICVYNFIKSLKSSISLIKSTPPIVISTFVPGAILVTVLSLSLEQAPEDVALFNISYQLRGLGVYLPLVAVNMFQTFNSRIENFEKKLIKVSLLFSIMIVVAMFIFSFFLTYVYGDEYYESGMILRILLPFVILNVRNEIYRQTWVKNLKSINLYFIPTTAYTLGYMAFITINAPVFLKLCIFVGCSELIYMVLSRLRSIE